MSAVLAQAAPAHSAKYAAGSLAHRLLKYFEGYPTLVSITAEDVSDRFVFALAGVHAGLALPLERGHLREARNADGECVYSPGWFDPAGKGAKSADSATVSALRQALTPKRKAREPLIDVGLIKIETGVPIPKKQTRNDWEGLLKRIPAGGSVHLNMVHLQNVKKHAKASGRPYHVEQDADGAKFRLWMEPEKVATA